MERASEKDKFYQLPSLPYGYRDLAPYISEEQLRIHHDKHHLAYVNGANAALEKLDKARKDGADLDFKCLAKEMSFHLGGNELHSTFWMNMAPAGKGGGGKPGNLLGDAINKEFGSFDRFKKEFTMTAMSAEGSAWAALTYCTGTKRLDIAQIEKHNVNFPPGYPILMVLDMWEHAYYIDYKNEKAKYVDGFWNIVNWGIVNKWFLEVAKPEMATV